MQRSFIIPFFRFESEAADNLFAGLALTHLKKFLNQAKQAQSFQSTTYSLSPPHEVFHAQALHLPTEDGQIPWAAFATSSQAPCAWITPCHWTVGVDSIQMGAINDLRLSTDHAHQLIAAMQPYFYQDGIELTHHSDQQWLAKGAVFEGLATASLDRVVGRHLSAWMPAQSKAAGLRRLQNEMQMLLYTHPVNDERLAQGLAPINSFWVHGAGALPANSKKPSITTIQIDARLKNPALQQDVQAWRLALQNIDQDLIQSLLVSPEDSHHIQLVLCGERGYQVWQREKSLFRPIFSSLFNKKSLQNMREQL